MTIAELFDLVLKFASFALSIGAMVVAIIRTRRNDVDGKLERANERFTEGARRMDRIDARLNALESTVDALPGREDVHVLQMTLADMRGDMKAQTAVIAAMSDAMKRLENAVSRHDDHLRKSP